MKQLLLLAVLLIYGSLTAQKEIIERGTELIVARQYKQAHKYLDSILKKSPQTVDALMMKGNVVLNQTLDTLPEEKFVTQEDESVFITQLKPKSKIVPISVVVQIEKYWRKCLLLDSSRIDIRKGLCSVYSMALMKTELEQEITALMKMEKDDGEQAFRMCEYARKFIERNNFDEGMKVYQFIAALYPQLPGVRADIASEYFYKGRMKDALTWLDSCYAFENIDETSFLNGAFIYSQLGYFYNAQDALNKYSNQYERKMGEFYYGIRLFADTADKYFEVLKTFTDKADTNAYSTEITLARRLMTYKDSFTIRDYRSLTNDSEIPDYYKVLLYTRGIRQFADECEPSVYYGVYLASIKNYSSATQFLEEIENCNLDFVSQEMIQLIYAYAVLQTQKERALPLFRQLFKTENSFIRHAAKYFAVKILMEQKQTEQATTLMKEVLVAPEKTKYSELLQLQYHLK